jgi:hypothetical protein
VSVRPLVDAWRYDSNDPGIVLFTQALQAWRFDLPEGARVLELGCCESVWANTLLATRPDVQIMGIDVRPCPGYPGTFVHGDAATMLRLPQPKFDAVVAIGSLEHFGLGYADYGDPVNPKADEVALSDAVEVVTTGGLVYYDVPWTPRTEFQTDHYRVYSDATLDGRLSPSVCVERARGWAPSVNVEDTPTLVVLPNGRAWRRRIGFAPARRDA